MNNQTLVPLNKLPRGEYVRLSPTTSITYRKGEYDRATKKFSLVDCDDTNRERLVRGDKVVYVGFDY